MITIGFEMAFAGLFEKVAQDFLQSQSTVMQNQSNSEITFVTKLKLVVVAGT